MSFNLEKFFVDIFAPVKGEVVTVMYDVPHGDFADNEEWTNRRDMAKEWRDKIARLSTQLEIKTNPLLTYNATGSHGGVLPEKGIMGNNEVELAKAIIDSTIILAMTEYSATAPLRMYIKKANRLRIASMPFVAKFMEKTSLAANYEKIQEKCKKMAPIFKEAVGSEVVFSTGHRCYFDISLDNPVHRSDGYLHPEAGGTIGALCNLPTGETYIVPNEKPDSKTEGELPQKFGDELAVYIVKHNKIVEVKGEGKEVEKMRQKFMSDPGWCNIAEFAIGCNEKAKVTGNQIEDEKAGFHWAYGRSDHFGGLVGVKDFTSPSNVIHWDVIYAKSCPIVCSKLDMIFKDGKHQTLIIDGELQV